MASPSGPAYDFLVGLSDEFSEYSSLAKVLMRELDPKIDLTSKKFPLYTELTMQ